MEDAAGSGGRGEAVEVNGTEDAAAASGGWVVPMLAYLLPDTGNWKVRAVAREWWEASIPERLPQFECTLAIMEHTKTCEALMQEIHHQYNLLGRSEITCKDFRKSRIPRAHFDMDARRTYALEIGDQLRLAEGMNDLMQILIAVRKHRRKLKLLLSTTHRMNVKKNAEEEEELSQRSRCAWAQVLVRAQDLLDAHAEPVEDRV